MRAPSRHRTACVLADPQRHHLRYSNTSVAARDRQDGGRGSDRRFHTDRHLTGDITDLAPRSQVLLLLGSTLDILGFLAKIDHNKSVGSLNGTPARCRAAQGRRPRDQICASSSSPPPHAPGDPPLGRRSEQVEVGGGTYTPLSLSGPEPAAADPPSGSLPPPRSRPLASLRS